LTEKIPEKKKVIMIHDKIQNKKIIGKNKRANDAALERAVNLS